MDSKLFNEMHSTRPKFNPMVAHGIVVEHLKQTQSYLDAIIRAAFDDIHPLISYRGLAPVTIEEGYAVMAQKRNSKARYDISRNDFYMVKLLIDFDGTPMKKSCYLMLPFARQAGIVHIRDSPYAISPVLTDLAISVGNRNIFLPINGSKDLFERLITQFYVNGAIHWEYVAWSSLYKRSVRSLRKSPKPNIRALTTLGHYLFCKYGVTEAFRKYANCEVLVGPTEQFPEDKYSPEEWAVCAPVGKPPQGLIDRVGYTPSTLRIVIRKKDWNTVSAGLISAFLYVLSFYPDRIHESYIDNIDLWRLLLGKIIFATDASEGKLLNDTVRHMDSLDCKLDIQSRITLAKGGVVVENYWGVLAHIVETYNERISRGIETIGSMKDKQLVTLRYIMLPIVTGIYNFKFGVMNRQKPILTEEDVTELIFMNIKTDLILQINHGHQEVRPISSACDNYAFNITGNVVSQATASGNTKARSNSKDPSRLLHIDILTIGNYNTLPKSSPYGKSRLNMFIGIDEYGNFVEDPDLMPLKTKVMNELLGN